MAPHSVRTTRCLLLLGLLGAATAARAEPPLSEAEVKQRYQAEACAAPGGWVQVRYGNAKLEVRCTSPRPPPPAARVTPAAAPARKGTSPEGYQKSRWGMNKTEVKRLYPGLRGKKNVLWFPTTVAGYRAITAFHFRDNALIRVIVAFRPPGGERGEPECFDRVRDALIEKYGPPLPEDGNAWETEETRIELSHDTAKVVNRLTATYFHKGSPPPDEEDEETGSDDRGL
jgi:hypothetical protein